MQTLQPPFPPTTLTFWMDKLKTELKPSSTQNCNLFIIYLLSASSSMNSVWHLMFLHNSITKIGLFFPNNPNLEQIIKNIFCFVFNERISDCRDETCYHGNQAERPDRNAFNTFSFSCFSHSFCLVPSTP